jgi:hypothetical protein
MSECCIILNGCHQARRNILCRPKRIPFLVPFLSRKRTVDDNARLKRPHGPLCDFTPDLGVAPVENSKDNLRICYISFVLLISIPYPIFLRSPISYESKRRDRRFKPSPKYNKQKRTNVILWIGPSTQHKGRCLQGGDKMDVVVSLTRIL